jgi:ABC-type amino acid transport system permease subunit
MMVDHGILGLFVLPLLILAALWGLRPAQYDLALPFAMFLSMWGFFSHNVLEERYILVAVALVGSIVASHRVRVEEPQRVAAPVVVSLGMSI